MSEQFVDITKVQIGHVVGPGGATLKGIQERTGAKLEVLQDGPKVKVTGEEDSQVEAAVAEVKKIIANQENPDYEGPEGARLRKEANALGDKRGKLFDEATAKRNAGDHAAANKLVEEGKQAGEDMQKRHREAAAAIAKYNNEDKGHGEDYFDMHGLREEEAMDMLKERVAVLEGKASGTVTEMEVIPGAGHHSAPGAQKLKGATEAYFKERGFEYEENSPGSFVVAIAGEGAAPASVAVSELSPENPYMENDADEEPPIMMARPIHTQPPVESDVEENHEPFTEEEEEEEDEAPILMSRPKNVQHVEQQQEQPQQEEEEISQPRTARIFIQMPPHIRARRDQLAGNKAAANSVHSSPASSAGQSDDGWHEPTTPQNSPAGGVVRGPTRSDRDVAAEPTAARNDTPQLLGSSGAEPERVQRENEGWHEEPHDDEQPQPQQSDADGGEVESVRSGGTERKEKAEKGCCTVM